MEHFATSTTSTLRLFLMNLYVPHLSSQFKDLQSMALSNFLLSNNILQEWLSFAE
jgi:hypothetical protein